MQWQTPPSSQTLSRLLSGDTLPLAEPPVGAHGYYLEIGRGMGTFSWFPDQETLLRYLAHVEVLHLPTRLPERSDYDALVQQMIAILEGYERHQNSPETVAAIQELLPDLGLRWLGQAASLRTDSGDFARQVQRDFAATADTPWLAFLSDYGI